MGVTNYDISLLKKIISQHNIKSVVELGAQNNFDQPDLPAPYMKEWYEQRGLKYLALDLNGENGASMIDLAKPVIEDLGAWDLVTDFGTSEHVSEMKLDYGNGVFSWEAIYNCWKIKFDLCAINGFILSENPRAGNWPGHGFNYYTFSFYTSLANLSGLSIQQIDHVAAMGNTVDGWNIMCLMKKINIKFPTLEEFRTLDLKTA